MILARATHDNVSARGPVKASTASRGVLPGKGNQHRHSGEGRIFVVLVLAVIPPGEKFFARDVERLARSAVEYGPALLASDLHDLDLMFRQFSRASLIQGLRL